MENLHERAATSERRLSASALESLRKIQALQSGSRSSLSSLSAASVHAQSGHITDAHVSDVSETKHGHAGSPARDAMHNDATSPVEAAVSQLMVADSVPHVSSDSEVDDAQVSSAAATAPKARGPRTPLRADAVPPNAATSSVSARLGTQRNNGAATTVASKGRSHAATGQARAHGASTQVSRGSRARKPPTAATTSPLSNSLPGTHAQRSPESDSTGTEGSVVEFESGDEHPGALAPGARRHSLPTPATLHQFQRAVSRDTSQSAGDQICDKSHQSGISSAKAHIMPAGAAPAAPHAQTRTGTSRSTPVRPRASEARRASIDMGAVSRASATTAARLPESVHVEPSANARKPAVPRQRETIHASREGGAVREKVTGPLSQAPKSQQARADVSPQGNAQLVLQQPAPASFRAQAALAPLMELIETIKKHAWEMDAMETATRMRAAAMTAATNERRSARQLDSKPGRPAAGPDAVADRTWEASAAKIRAAGSAYTGLTSDSAEDAGDTADKVHDDDTSAPAEQLTSAATAGVEAMASLPFPTGVMQEPPAEVREPHRWVHSDVRSQPVTAEDADMASLQQRRAAGAVIEATMAAEDAVAETDFVVALQRMLGASKLVAVTTQHDAISRARAFYKWRNFAAVEKAVEHTLGLFKQVLQTNAQPAPTDPVHNAAAIGTADTAALPAADASSQLPQPLAPQPLAPLSKRHPATNIAKRDALAARAAARYSAQKPPRRASLTDASARPVAMARSPSGRLAPRVEVLDMDGGHSLVLNEGVAAHVASPALSSDTAIVQVVRVERGDRPVGVTARVAPATVGKRSPQHAWADDREVEVTTVMADTLPDRQLHVLDLVNDHRDDGDDNNATDLARVRVPGDAASPLRVRELDALGRPARASYAHADYWKHVMQSDTRGIAMNGTTSKRRQVGRSASASRDRPDIDRSQHARETEYIAGALTSTTQPDVLSSSTIRGLLGRGRAPVAKLHLHPRSTPQSGIEEIGAGSHKVAAGSPSRFPARHEDIIDARRKRLGLKSATRNSRGASGSIDPPESHRTVRTPLLHQLTSPLRESQAQAAVYRYAPTSAATRLLEQVISVVQPADARPQALDSEAPAPDRKVFVIHDKSRAERKGDTQTYAGTGVALASPATRTAVSHAAQGAAHADGLSPLLGSRVSEQVVVTDERKIGSVVVRDVKHVAEVTNAFGWHLANDAASLDTRSPSIARPVRVLQASRFIASPAGGHLSSVGQPDAYVVAEKGLLGPAPLSSPRPLTYARNTTTRVRESAGLRARRS